MHISYVERRIGLSQGSQTVRVSWESLTALVAQLLQCRGVPPSEAQLAADIIVLADARGYGAHGVWRLAFTLDRLDAGTITSPAKSTITTDLGAFAVLDGGNGLGQVVTHGAFELARERARQFGVGGVLVANSNHFGIAQAYTEPAAREGFVAILVTNASPAMAPFGGSERLLGNNPWSIAAPSHRGPPIVIDLTMTTVSRGEILLARDKGELIPEGWALDQRGRPTTHPAEALRGVMLPMAGHKGYALSVAADLLTGVLSGSAWLDGVGFPGDAAVRGRVSHLVLIIDAQRLDPTYPERVAVYAERLRSSQPAGAKGAVQVPGDRESHAEEESRALGVPLSHEALIVVQRYADEAGVDVELSIKPS